MSTRQPVRKRLDEHLVVGVLLKLGDVVEHDPVESPSREETSDKFPEQVRSAVGAVRWVVVTQTNGAAPEVTE